MVLVGGSGGIQGAAGAGSGLQVKIINGARLAAEGNGSEQVTGVGFTPITAFVMAAATGGEVHLASWALIQDTVSWALSQDDSGGIEAGPSNPTININDVTGVKSMQATFTEFLADGLQWEWALVGGGFDVVYVIMFLG